MWSRGDAKGKLSSEISLSTVTKLGTVTIPPTLSSINNRHPHIQMNSTIRITINNMTDEISILLSQIHCCPKDNNKLISTIKNRDWSKYLQSL